jgi:hypothetical protein
MNTVTKTKADVKPEILEVPWVTPPVEVEYPESPYSYGNGTNGADEWKSRECKWMRIDQKDVGEDGDDSRAHSKLYNRIAKAYSREVAVRDEDDDSLMWAV